ncbi:uncharacterized protein LOC144450169 [Glandiceps talaboti]
MALMRGLHNWEMFEVYTETPKSVPPFHRVKLCHRKRSEHRLRSFRCAGGKLSNSPTFLRGDEILLQLFTYKGTARHLSQGKATRVRSRCSYVRTTLSLMVIITCYSMETNRTQNNKMRKFLPKTIPK